MEHKWKLKKLKCSENIIIEICDDIFTIGRTSTAHIVSTLTHISRNHAKIISERGQIYIFDNASSNGTFVNDTIIKTRHNVLLKNDDVVSFGSSLDSVNVTEVLAYKVIKEETRDTIERLNTDTKNLNSNKLNSCMDVESVPSTSKTNNDNISVTTGNNVVKPNRPPRECIEKELLRIFNATDLEPSNCLNSIQNSQIKSLEDSQDNKQQKENDLKSTEKKTESTSNENGALKKLIIDIESCESSLDRDLQSLKNAIQSTELSNHDIKNDSTENSKKSNQQFSTKDDYIIVISDDEDADDFSSSQIYQLSKSVKEEPTEDDRSYIKIKQELEFLDYDERNVLNQVPIDLDGNILATEDLILQLEGNSPKVVPPETTTTHNDIHTAKENKNKQKYLKTPIVEAHQLKTKKSKKEEQKTKSVRKGKSSKGNIDNSKKDKCDRGTKEEKEKRTQTRKEKLKEIAVKEKPESIKNKNEASKLSTKAKVKVSESRGNFLLEPTPGPSNTRKRPSEQPDKHLNISNNKIPKRTSDTFVTNGVSPSNLNIPLSSFQNNKIPKRTATATKIHSDPVSVVGSAYEDSQSNSLMWGTFKQPRYNLLNVKVNIDDVYERIVNWSINWLKEQKDNTTSPPLNPHPAVKMSKNFRSFKEYLDVVSGLIYLEMWYNLCESFYKEACDPFRAKIIHKRFSENTVAMDCECYLTEEEAKQQFRVNDCCLIELKMKLNEKRTRATLFCVVLKCNKKVIEQEEIIDNAIAALCPGIPHTRINFTVVTKHIKNLTFETPNVILRQAANLSCNFKLFKTVRLLEKSPLCKLIISPMIEDYSMPHYKSKLIMQEMLNDVQTHIVREAAYLCLSGKPGFYMVQGPPGTGKTRVIINLVLQILFAENMKKSVILLTAPSNMAVDNLLKKIEDARATFGDQERKNIKVIRMGPENSMTKNSQGFTLHILGKNHMFNNLWRRDDFNRRMPECEREAYIRRCHGSKYRYELQNAEQAVLEGCNVICTTLNSSLNYRIVDAVKKSKLKFTCCIVDEATQCSEIECLVPTQLGIEKFVLVGDPKQLPATVVSPEATNLGFGQSFFTRISENFRGHASNPIRMLTDQYRMHQSICDFPNRYFYEGKLKTFASFQNPITPNIRPYLVFGLHDHDNITDNYYNMEEVRLVYNIVSVLTSNIATTSYSIGIITPYTAQRQKVLDAIKSCRISNRIDIEVNTVDSFQGQEKDIVIISCVRYSPNNFLTNQKRLNVALTRARQALYLIGNYKLFKNCELFYELREDAKRRKLTVDFKDMPSKMHQCLKERLFVN